MKFPELSLDQRRQLIDVQQRFEAFGPLIGHFANAIRER
jgi:hypothetical protein